MSAGSPLTIGKHLVGDTFRQAWASGISWILLVGTAICVLLCLSVNISGVAPIYAEGEPGYFLPPPSPRIIVPSVVQVLGSSGTLDALTRTIASSRTWLALENNPDVAGHEGIVTISGKMSLAFGAISFPVARDKAEAVRFLELLLSGGVAGTLGLLLALVWTAGFVPSFLDPSAASVLLAKPVARWQLLLGKYLGVLTFLVVQATMFIGLTWLALGLRTNVWDLTYWWSIPLLLVQFAIFYSFSVLIGVLTRSTGASVAGAVLFWLLAWGINYGTVMAHSLPERQDLPALTQILTEAGYWISPKPIDAALILFNSLDAQEHFEKPAIFQLLEAKASFSPLLSILSSLAITAVLLALAAFEFHAIDY